ncbi:conjugative transposon protein TraK [Pedobacter sp. SYP-B3415]|uniref:conjugative transposon protein TraK n=1 Tax=Pedobacter sp. SYP-B3415 TaxID=2496641 RepID=UPI00101DF2F3|nr:conjugative transposon protein TraK [Pedobacter sp. SYP-B3415]
MFDQLKNIDTAFSHVKRLTIAILLFCLITSVSALVVAFLLIKDAQRRIYVLSSGRAIEALSSTKRENLQVEASDHVRRFHELFFSLDPDDKLIRANVSQALALSDESARQEYENLKEQGYYANIISANISQRVVIDSIQIDTHSEPFSFMFYGRQLLKRSSSQLERSLLTRGSLRQVARSESNPHGFLIQQWQIHENKDLSNRISDETIKQK